MLELINYSKRFRLLVFVGILN